MYVMRKYKNKEIKCPECGSEQFSDIGTQWRKRVKWSKEIGNRIRVAKLQCKNCGRYYREELEEGK